MLEINKIYDNSINICFACNNTFFDYLVVCIHSILKNANKNDNYDIVILENCITKNNKEILKQHESNNVSIRFYDMPEILENLDINLPFSIEQYFRLFIPYIFKKYDKVLYLDCNAVCLSDIAEIYNQNLEGNLIGAVKDFIVMNQIIAEVDNEYYFDKLRLSNPLNYINSGVMLLDIQKLLDFGFVDKSLDLLKTFQPKFVDQCIINKVVDGHFKFLDPKYNVSSILEELFLNNLDENYLSNEVISEYKKSLINPVYIHYGKILM